MSLVAAGPAAAARAGAPYIRGGQTVPMYSYKNAIRESVFVQTTMDSDHDGKPDRIAADIVRPRTGDVRVPVIMEASPYYSCCGRGNQSQLKGYDGNGVINAMPLYYDNYFVPRGYAFVGVDLTGTNRSTGCSDSGGPAEVQGAKSVIDWLEGRAKAYDRAGHPVTASWTNGKVGMIGKSWDGSIANGVAATGVQGLTTIVPISSISSWYDYMRFQGVLRSPDYVTFLDGYVSSHRAKCRAEFAQQQAASADRTGSVNRFWARRDYRPSADKVHASVFIAHGLNDLNVTTNQFGAWWLDLAAHHVPRKIWLSQTGHVDPFDYRRGPWVAELHRWFDYWLQGVQNGVMSEPQATIERPDGRWVQQASWPAPGARPTMVPLGGSAGSTGVLGATSRAIETVTDVPDQTEAEAVSHPNRPQPGRLVFLSAPLSRPLHISGFPSVTVRIKVDKPTTELTARLVDYGRQRRVDYQSAGEGIRTLTTSSCWGRSTAADSACYFTTALTYVTSNVDVLARGWQDAAHYRSLRTVTPLRPDRWYTVRIPVDPYEDVLAPGHVLGLVLTLSDRENTTPTTVGATVRYALAGSTLSLPVAGPGLPTTSAAPSVSAETRAAPAHARQLPG